MQRWQSNMPSNVYGTVFVIKIHIDVKIPQLRCALGRIIKSGCIITTITLWYNYATTIKETKMAVCVPIRDLKDTSKFSDLVMREHEVIVTKNGYNAFRCISEERMAAIELLEEKEKLRSRLTLAAKETEEGSSIPYSELRALL